jgi:hypothetical protein
MNRFANAPVKTFQSNEERIKHKLIRVKKHSYSKGNRADKYFPLTKCTGTGGTVLGYLLTAVSVANFSVNNSHLQRIVFIF